ncbi:MAG: potassium channel protein [Gemmatimonadetes bacterium]|nr:potassium channel protein [Gemmatimonadota bacterium]
MKFFPAQLSYLTEGQSARRNLSVLGRFIAVLAVMITVYSITFHLIMVHEGQDHSWVTGFYWTLTVMSTLGFGDITFQTDLGRVFSILVLVSGVMFLLIVLPFTFIQFFYAPWLEAQTRRRVPRELDASVTDHILLAAHEPVAAALIDRLNSMGSPYFIIEPELAKALEMEEAGLSVLLGSPEDIETYRRARTASARMVVANVDDEVNTNIAFTVRELDERVPIVSLARDEASVDVLELAGSTKVIQLPDLLGRSLARRVLAGDHRASVIGEFGELLVAEAPVAGTPLVGRTLGDGWLREMTGLTAVGAWERGRFDVPGSTTVIHPSTVLVLVGTQHQLDDFKELTAIYRSSDAPVVILGGGRVGRGAAAALAERGLAFCLVERNPDRVRLSENTVIGNAADLPVLEEAGIREAPTVMVTTANDATNIYLTIYCRRLRPDVQIISRATLERNVSTLHRAGADFVMSYASMGASAILNVVERDDLVMVAEGLDLFRVPVPEELRGIALRACRIREDTGCHVVAVQDQGIVHPGPSPAKPLPTKTGSELILVGTTENEVRFRERFGVSRS